MSEWASTRSTTTPERRSSPPGAASPTTRVSTAPSTVQQRTLAKRPNARLSPKQMLSPKTSATCAIMRADEAAPGQSDTKTTETRLLLHADPAGVKMPETPVVSAADRPPAPPSREVDGVQSAASTHTAGRVQESSPRPTPTMFQNTSSSNLQPLGQRRHSTPSTALNATPTSEHPETSASLITNTPARQSETQIPRPTTTSSASMTTWVNSTSEMPLEQHASDVPASNAANVEPIGAARQNSLSPPKRLRPVVEGDTADEFLDYSVRPQKRSKTISNMAIEYDENGIPRLKAAQKSSAVPEMVSPIMVAEPQSPTIADTTALLPQTSATMLCRSLPPSMPLSTTVTTKHTSCEASRKQFNLLGAIIEDSSLIITLVSYLDIPTLISWYAIDKKFHWYYNKNYTAFILASVRTWAPGADRIFPWRHYEALCIKDPLKRQKAKADPLGQEFARMNLFSRDVPSMRWLQMVVWREGVVKDMTIQLATKALRTPFPTRDAVKRLWFIMDLPLNAHRLACIQSETYIINQTLFLATHFFLKVDMFLTDPAYRPYPANHPNQAVWPQRWAHGMALGCSLREKLLSEASLTPLWRVMRGWAPDGPLNGRPIQTVDILKLWMRHKFRFNSRTPARVDRSLPVLGLKMEQFCLVGYERLVRPTVDARFKPNPILSLDLLVMGEAVRRRIDMSLRWFEMMAWGFNSKSGRKLRTLTEEQMLQADRSYWTPKEKMIIAWNKVKEKKSLEAAAAAAAEDMDVDEDGQAVSGSTSLE